MKRALPPLVLGTTIVAIVASFFIYRVRPSDVPAALRAQMDRGAGHVFALASHTDFEWDRVFFFGPYTTREDIETELGFAWQGPFHSSIASSDSVNLVVFVNGKKIVDHFDVSRGAADLTSCAKAGRKGLAPERARFRVEKGDALTLVGLPANE